MRWTPGRAWCGLLLPVLLASFAVQAHAQAQEPSRAVLARNYAPGFTARAPESQLLIVPLEVELLSISAGGVIEPREDWTQAAQQHMRAALASKAALLGSRTRDLPDREMDDFGQLVAVHGAVAQSIRAHHTGSPSIPLPTKRNRLDWSLGDAVQPLRQRTGADYALFIRVRDSYASASRKAAIVGLALVGFAISAGEQEAYASLVDLRDGRVVWFNSLQRGRGDLREADTARETVDLLLANFPLQR